jgi:hypothetical protein
VQENIKRGRPLLLPLQAIPTPSIARRGAPFLQPPFIIISKYFKNLRGISNPPYWKWGVGGALFGHLRRSIFNKWEAGGNLQNFCEHNSIAMPNIKKLLQNNFLSLPPIF